MILPVPTFLVRHGRDYLDSGRNPGHLAPVGEQQAREALDELVRRGLGKSSIVLTTRAVRVKETGEIIAAGLGAELIEGSTEFTRFSVMPGGPKGLDDVLIDEVAAAGHDVDALAADGGSLVVVCNSGLIAITKGFDVLEQSGSDGRIPHGSITPYEPGSWEVF